MGAPHGSRSTLVGAREREPDKVGRGTGSTASLLPKGAGTHLRATEVRRPPLSADAVGFQQDINEAVGSEKYPQLE